MQNKNDRTWVFLVDDDPYILRSVGRLLQSEGYQCRAFESAVAFLEAELEPFDAACLLLDIRMPEMSGVELQKRLPGTDRDVPIIFVSAYGDIPTCVKTLKAGAFGFLPKPFDPQELIKATGEALVLSLKQKEQRAQREAAQKTFERLSRREREVFRLVTQGLLNRKIAETLGIAEKTVKIHRGHMMTKLGLRSVADLVRLAAMLGDDAAPAALTGGLEVSGRAGF